MSFWEYLGKTILLVVAMAFVAQSQMQTNSFMSFLIGSFGSCCVAAYVSWSNKVKKD